MYNDYALKLALNALPYVALCFVLLLLLAKFYTKIRAKFNCKVNCWFCNENSVVPYLQANSWTCRHCEQYNGFTKDGDYNKDIQQQQQQQQKLLNCSKSSGSVLNSSGMSTRSSTLLPARNGFCDACNEAQRLKVEKLAQFEPKHESQFEAELKQYKAQLEQRYSLCSSCDRHLAKVLREKKKMVLGSKFLDLIMRSAKYLKQPQVHSQAKQQQLRWKRRCTWLFVLLTGLNVICLFSAMPSLSRDWLTAQLGESFGLELFKVLSHFVALLRVLQDYISRFANWQIFAKMQLFLRTLGMMLIYSLGLKWPLWSQLQLCSLYMQSMPFVLLTLAFTHNLLDNFRLTRFTFLLGLWSVFASGLLQQPHSLMCLASMLSCFLSFTSSSRHEHKLFDQSADSFHKIYSEDYFSDDETISLLSEQLNCSNSSVRSTPINHHTQVNATRLTKSPLTSSAFSLNQMSNATLTPFATHQQLPSYAPVNQHSLYASHVNLQPNISARSNNSAAPAFLNSSFGFTSQQPLKNASLHSPYSLSSNNLLQTQRGSTNLLTPSRLGGSCLMGNTAASSWLSGGYFNQRAQMAQDIFGSQNEERMSRASSQSSGFESQQNGFNCSHENAASADVTMLQRSAFKPIESTLSGARKPLPSYDRFSKPLSINCSMASEQATATKQQPMQHKRLHFAGSSDSFNLQRIHEELPQLQRGDLLKKWHQSQQQQQAIS